MKRTLKQPCKFTHSALMPNQSDDSDQEEGEGKGTSGAPEKHKQIQRETYTRKKIGNPLAPCAQRHSQINEVFSRIGQRADYFLWQLHINHQLLDALSQLRAKFECACGKKVKFYCLQCGSLCPMVPEPGIALPFRVSVIHHSFEKMSKSSIAPMQLLAPSIKVYPFSSHEQQNQKQVFDKLPENRAATFILYPHPRSKTLSEVRGPIEQLVVLDCTWFQSDQMVGELAAHGYRNFIRLEGYQSIYWRYNHYSDCALSSAEALHYLLREWQARVGGYPKRYDELMLFYALSLRMVGSTVPSC